MRRKRRFPIAAADDENTTFRVVDGAGFDSDFLVIGEVVRLSDEGISVVASLDGNYDDQHAYTFVDDDGYDIGGLYGRDDAGQNIVALRAVDPPGNGDDVLVNIVATADPANVSTAAAEVSISANRVGEASDTGIEIERDDNTSRVDILANLENGRVRIGPVLNLLGSALELCDVYITGSYFVIKYDDDGTIRYKYLDLSGMGSAWGQSTSAP